MNLANVTDKRPAYNERFGATAAVIPQKMLWENERLSPATKVVEAAADAKPPSRCKQCGRSRIAVRLTHNYLI